MITMPPSDYFFGYHCHSLMLIFLYTIHFSDIFRHIELPLLTINIVIIFRRLRHYKMSWRIFFSYIILGLTDASLYLRCPATHEDIRHCTLHAASFSATPRLRFMSLPLPLHIIIYWYYISQVFHMLPPLMPSFSSHDISPSNIRTHRIDIEACLLSRSTETRFAMLLDETWDTLFFW